MRWKITTEKKTYVVNATNSRDAVSYIRDKKKDDSTVKSAKLLPKNTVDHIKSKWRNLFGK